MGVYQELERKLDYSLYQEDLIVGSGSELMLLAKQAVASGQASLLFRYDGSEKSLKTDLQELYALGMDHLSYNSSPFDNTGDLKVYVTWE